MFILEKLAGMMGDSEPEEVSEDLRRKMETMKQLGMNMLELIADEREVTLEFHQMFNIIPKEFLDVLQPREEVSELVEAKETELGSKPEEVSEMVEANETELANKQQGLLRQNSEKR